MMDLPSRARAKSSPSGASTIGTSAGDLITGDRRPDLDTLDGRGGSDIIEGGPRAERILGGPGDDVLSGGGGNDLIVTGDGDDAADGGPGRDRLTAVGGVNHLDGGDGPDQIVTRGSGTDSLAIGGDGNDLLVARGGRANLWGGPGNDVYELRRGRVEVVERPDEGRDRIHSWTSARAVPNVEVLQLRGGRDLDATGTAERDVMIGNSGDNRIDGGAGPDRIVAGAGNDTIVLAGFGYDTATGGPGRDSYELRSVPVLGPRGGGLERPAARTAHRITDFRVGQDVIVLDEDELGPEVRALATTPRLVQGPGARPTEAAPTLVYDTAGSLATYDPDGVGPKADVVLAVLEDVPELSIDAFEITG